MAPSRGKGKASVYPLQKLSPTQATRRIPRRATQGNDGVPSVFQDLLAEVSTDHSEDVPSSRPLKRRKVAASRSAARSDVQTVEDSSASSDNPDDSELDFEDVDLEQTGASSPPAVKSGDDDIQDISVAVDSSKAPKRIQASKRKTATPGEKAHRLLVHKLHILCLLGHCMYANSWCNDEQVHLQLLELVPEKTQSYLTHNLEFSQFQQNRSFMDGLQQAVELWRGAFKATASGMHRPKWQALGTQSHDNGLNPLDRGELRLAAKELEGSQDTGSQLFCALLRAVGVDARLVCSLQVLPFALSAKDNAVLPTKDVKNIVYASALGIESADSHTEDAAMRNSLTVGKVPSARRRLGQPGFVNSSSAATTTPERQKPIRKLTYPVFWVEAFNKAHQTWIPVDPLVTQTIGKASKLEPPSNYEWNQMSYIVAFERDGVARDVTKRYAKAYNAKTRRARVESAEIDGSIWFRRALRRFRRPKVDDDGRDRDQIEDAQLAQREAQEGLPSNVQDFKHHPYYALERHLRRHEVIHPRREVGKVNAGTAAKPRMEPVFRRSDVQACKSAEKWFRSGREIKEGEQALKSVPARRSRNVRAASEENDGEEVMISALYAPFQTQIYTPPPVVTGKVPRNAYGNLDVYVPSMVPPGGAHIRHPLAKEAARVLRVDAVDAVTGFKFQGRQGTAITEGVIVAADFKDSVEAVIEGLQNEQSEQNGMARSVLALKMWKRFLTGLRIKERVSAYGDPSAEVPEDAEIGDLETDCVDAAGGFLIEDIVNHDDSNGLPTAGRYSLTELLDVTPTKTKVRKARKVETEESEQAEFSDADDADKEEGGFEPEVSTRGTRASKRVVVADVSEGEDRLQVREQNDEAEDRGGGFVPEEDMGGGSLVDENMEGGFMVEDEQHNDATQGNDENGGFMIDGDAVVKPQELDHRTEENARTRPVELVGSDPQTDVLMRDRSPSLKSQSSALASACKTSVVAVADEVALSDDAAQRTKTLEVGSELDWQVRGLAEADNHVWPQEVDDDSDQGSMLSHDPEDEDAEPDWLESD
jgi:xeroderma pigmentosum group C-complementing protein